MPRIREPLGLIPNVIRQRELIISDNNKRIQRIVTAFASIVKRLQPQVDNLAKTIELENIKTRAALVRLPEYTQLVGDYTQQLDDFVGMVRVDLNDVINWSSAVALAGVTQWAADFGITIQNKWSVDQLSILLDYLKPGGALADRIALWAPNAVQGVSQTIIDMVIAGKNPRTIASALVKQFGVPLTDALRTTRTVQLWSYRETTRAFYKANPDVSAGWIWYAQLDEATCMSCIAQHGTFHTWDEALDDHYNGRCSQIPVPVGFEDYVRANIVKQSGEDWFNTQTPEQQAKQMGADKLAAWQAGKFTFDKLSVQEQVDVYGSMRFESSLKDLIGENK